MVIAITTHYIAISVEGFVINGINATHLIQLFIAGDTHKVRTIAATQRTAFGNGL